MAIQTVILGILSDQSGGQATLSFDYDDVTLLMSAIRLDNKSSRSVFVSATSTTNGKVYSATVAPGQLGSISISSTQANRLQLTVIPPGKLDGVEYQFTML